MIPLSFVPLIALAAALLLLVVLHSGRR